MYFFTALFLKTTVTCESRIDDGTAPANRKPRSAPSNPLNLSQRLQNPTSIMRIPLPIAIASCVAAVSATWFWGSRSTNFTTPPTEAENQALSERWKQNNSLSRRPDSPANPTSDAANTSETAEGSKKKPEASPLIRPKSITSQPEKLGEQKSPPRLPLGDIEQSPGLAEYGTLGAQGSASMIQLAQELATHGARERALLAWERVLDTTQPNAQQTSQAITAIRQLKSSLPPWNPDPTADISITLHAGATTQNKQALEQALKKTADAISEASGHLFAVKTKMAIGSGKPAATPRIPVAIWFSYGQSKPVQTDPFSFLANPNDTTQLTEKCQSAVYSLIANQLEEKTSYSRLPESSQAAPDKPAPALTGRDKIKYSISRLLWKEFINSL